MATASDSHRAPEERTLVDGSTAGSSNMRLATMAPRQPPIDLGGDVAADVPGSDVAEGSIEQGDDGVEVGARDGAEHPDQRDERSRGGGRVLQQLQSDVVGGQAAGHDPGPDHRHDEETCAQRLGEEAPGEVPLQRAGPGFWLVGQIAHGVAGQQQWAAVSGTSAPSSISKQQVAPVSGSTARSCPPSISTSSRTV